MVSIMQLHVSTEHRLLQQLLDDFKPNVLITDLEHIAKDEGISSRIPQVLLLTEIWPENPLTNVRGSASEFRRWGQRQTQTSTVLFTSGSTGLPKGVVLPETNIPKNAEIISNLLTLCEQDVGALFGPLTMGMNQIYVMAHLMSGAAILLEENFLSPNDIAANFAKHAVTGFSTIPAAIDILMTRCEPRVLDTLRLRYIRIGAGRFPKDKVRMVLERFAGIQVIKTYGLTEIGLATVLDSDASSAVCDSVGKAVADVTVEIVDEDGLPLPPYAKGEVVVSGAHQMVKYFNNRQETAATIRNGRIHTGDLGYKDRDGYLFITDRLKEMIKIAGESIHPGKIEQVIGRIKGVIDAVVIPVEDPIMGEAAKAMVETDPAAVLSSQDILKHCRNHLPSRLVPKSVVVLNKLPRTASGKVDRKQLLGGHE